MEAAKKMKDYFAKDQKNSLIEEVLKKEDHTELIHNKLITTARTSTQHNNAVLEIASAIREHISKEGMECRTFSENVALFCDELTENMPGNLFLPDVMCVCDKSGVRDDGVHTVPVFVAEITSDSTKRQDYGKKMLVYGEMGVKEYWVVDLQRKAVVRYLSDSEYVPDIYSYPACRELALYVCPSLQIDLSHIFEE